MQKGLIFNIQKFSIHDGPGIRTTVFLKGCPLQCKWCANPESQLAKVQILYDKDACIHCGTCIQVCPHGAVHEIDHKIHIDSNRCVGCLNCVQSCPKQALKNEGNYTDVQSIVNTCLQDIDFYEESGGGVTISGGEGMSQPTLLRELTSELAKHKIHLAIETTGYIESSLFQELAGLFDLLLFDMKHYDADKHKEGTGVSNELILKNLTWALSQGMEVLPRIPVIPAFNDSLEDARGFAAILKQVGADKVQLLPFHQFGEKKYEMLHKEYAYHNKKALHPEDLKDYQNIFLEEGLNCFF